MPAKLGLAGLRLRLGSLRLGLASFWLRLASFWLRLASPRFHAASVRQAYSTVTLLARFRGLSTSLPSATAAW